MIKEIDNETMFKNIYQLPPAHYLILENGKIKIENYWRLKNEQNNKDYFTSDKELINQFRDLFFSSIKMRLRSDVPVGALLSGGLDSSAIVSVINSIAKKEKLPVDIKTFTAAYKEKEIDESNYAKEVVKGTKIPNVLVYPNLNNNISCDIDKIMYHQDEPPISMTVFPHWYLMHEIKKHGIKVIISGQGSDEMLAGYLEQFLGYSLVDLLSNYRYQRFFHDIKKFKDKSNIKYSIILLQILKAIATRRIGMLAKSLMRDKGILYLRPDFIKNNWKVYNYKETMTKYSRLNESLYRALTLDSPPYILHYEDRNSMAFSIEQRVPFLDYRLVEFLFSLSNKQKIDNGISKIILRNSLKGIMPEKVRQRYSKLGFTVPVNKWMREMKNYAFNILNSRDFNKRIYWNPTKLRKLYKKQLKGEVNMEHFFWRIIACEIWHRIYFDK